MDATNQALGCAPLVPAIAVVGPEVSVGLPALQHEVDRGEHRGSHGDDRFVLGASLVLDRGVH